MCWQLVFVDLRQTLCALHCGDFHNHLISVRGFGSFELIQMSYSDALTLDDFLTVFAPTQHMMNKSLGWDPATSPGSTVKRIIQHSGRTTSADVHTKTLQSSPLLPVVAPIREMTSWIIRRVPSMTIRRTDEEPYVGRIKVCRTADSFRELCFDNNAAFPADRYAPTHAVARTPHQSAGASS
jgi:hypothetical protein